MTEDATDLNSNFMQPNNLNETEDDIFHYYEEPYEYAQNPVLQSLYERKLSSIQKEETEINHINLLFQSIQSNEKLFELKTPTPQKDLETLTESDLNEYIQQITIPNPNVKTFRVFTNPNLYYMLDEIYDRISYDAATFNTENHIIQNKTTLGKKRQRKIRKYKPDDIRKKIKARFHKTLKNIINYKLKKAGSTLLFDFLPQSFICNISKEKNRRLLNLTYYDILKRNFVKEIGTNKYRKKDVDETKYQNNLNVLGYLARHPNICKKSGFDIISKMKYIDILNEYFSSAEYKYSIISLKEENEDLTYIKEYQSKAKGYIEFFCKE